jgi:hypothetical protein
VSDQLTSEEEHAALDDDLSRWKSEAREWVGREGRSGRDETVARLLDARAATLHLPRRRAPQYRPRRLKHATRGQKKWKK